MKLRQLFSGSSNTPQYVQLQPETLQAINEIAAEERRPLNDVIDNLLRFALKEHQLAQNSLDVWRQLTQREREITAYIWLGLTNPQIADTLSISPNTVKTHIKNILAKFDTNSKENLREMLATLDFSDWVDIDIR